MESPMTGPLETTLESPLADEYKVRLHPVKHLTVGDLYCGGGGYSEGFRQMGFRILWAVDNWSPAVETHKKNHPEINVIQADVRSLDPETLPRPDILLGSPPCTFFSLSNRGGNGDKTRGMELVYRFLYFVHVLRPSYWIMENVPQLEPFLSKPIPLRDIGVDKPGHLVIPTRVILNAADFGVAQRRKRLFCGNFPLPMPTHAKKAADGNGALTAWRGMGDVIKSLPDPLEVDKIASQCKDPNYPLSISSAQLTEHFHHVSLSDEDMQVIRRNKQQHSFYGRMAIPERSDLPARTICAQQTGRGREAFVVASVNGQTHLRRLSIRECASLQGYPITYQFWGKTLQDRYALVGNSVAVGMSRALAQAVLVAADCPRPENPLVNKTVNAMPEAIKVSPKTQSKPHRFNIGRRFRNHVPFCRQNNQRIDLDNEGRPLPLHPIATRLKKVGKPPTHIKRWQARFHLGIGEGFRKQYISAGKAHKEFITATQDRDLRMRLQGFMSAIEKTLGPQIPDASTVQAAWTRHVDGANQGPFWILERIAQHLQKWFPLKKFRDVQLPRSGYIAIAPAGGVYVRLLAAMIATAYVAEVMNEGSTWMAEHPNKVFKLGREDFSPKVIRSIKRSRPTFKRLLRTVKA